MDPVRLVLVGVVGVALGLFLAAAEFGAFLLGGGLAAGVVGVSGVVAGLLVERDGSADRPAASARR